MLPNEPAVGATATLSTTTLPASALSTTIPAPAVATTTLAVATTTLAVTSTTVALPTPTGTLTTAGLRSDEPDRLFGDHHTNEWHGLSECQDLESSSGQHVAQKCGRQRLRFQNGFSQYSNQILHQRRYARLTPRLSTMCCRVHHG
mgnify:CR=1 FL=1